MSTLSNKFIFYWNYIVRFRGDNIRYLRHLGMYIGDDCSISTSVGNFGTEPWLIQIGHHVTITDGVVFLTHDGSSRIFRKTIPSMNPKYGNRFGTIQIQDNCFIGINTIILPGVSIGPNAIVGAGSLVTKGVPADTVFAGNPARFITTLDDYIADYHGKMIPVEATRRVALRRELTLGLWGEER